MAGKGAKRFLSLSTILASFFGAAMIAAAFAYYNYKFSQFKFIDFKQFIFYEKTDIFQPKEKRYIVVFYSSKEPQTMEQLAQLNLHTPILAIDYYNQVRPNTQYTTFLHSGTNTTLKFIQRFNIYNQPTLFFIKQEKGTLYKQDSMIRTFDTLKKLTQSLPH